MWKLEDIVGVNLDLNCFSTGYALRSRGLHQTVDEHLTQVEMSQKSIGTDPKKGKKDESKSERSTLNKKRKKNEKNKEENDDDESDSDESKSERSTLNKKRKKNEKNKEENDGDSSEDDDESDSDASDGSDDKEDDSSDEEPYEQEHGLECDETVKTAVYLGYWEDLYPNSISCGYMKSKQKYSLFH
jgi:hypothetical protein